MIDRKETLRDQIATIVQAGYSQRKTSVETADQIIELILKPEQERDVTRICPELMRFLDQQRVEAGRAGDRDMLKHLVLMADGVEKALKFYNKCALPPCALKLSDCATTLEEARGVIDRQEALIAELRKDMVRLDWLADPKNTIGNVTLPTQHIMDHPDSMRAAIDAAMEGDK